eukprot:m.212873 g.212873  ORF g.212873 m.212873 type:complete len:755 (+) comp33136_c0_seq2:1016-3280(+)
MFSGVPTTFPTEFPSFLPTPFPSLEPTSAPGTNPTPPTTQPRTTSLSSISSSSSSQDATISVSLSSAPDPTQSSLSSSPTLTLTTQTSSLSRTASVSSVSSPVSTTFTSTHTVDVVTADTSENNFDASTQEAKTLWFSGDYATVFATKQDRTDFAVVLRTEIVSLSINRFGHHRRQQEPFVGSYFTFSSSSNIAFGVEFIVTTKLVAVIDQAVVSDTKLCIDFKSQSFCALLEKPEAGESMQDNTGNADTDKNSINENDINKSTSSSKSDYSKTIIVISAVTAIIIIVAVLVLIRNSRRRGLIKGRARIITPSQDQGIVLAPAKFDTNFGDDGDVLYEAISPQPRKAPTPEEFRSTSQNSAVMLFHDYDTTIVGTSSSRDPTYDSAGETPATKGLMEKMTPSTTYALATPTTNNDDAYFFATPKMNKNVDYNQATPKGLDPQYEVATPGNTVVMYDEATPCALESLYDEATPRGAMNATLFQNSRIAKVDETSFSTYDNSRPTDITVNTTAIQKASPYSDLTGQYKRHYFSGAQIMTQFAATVDESLQEGFYDAGTVAGKDELKNATNLTRMVSPMFSDLGAESDPDSPLSPYVMSPNIKAATPHDYAALHAHEPLIVSPTPVSPILTAKTQVVQRKSTHPLGRSPLSALNKMRSTTTNPAASPLANTNVTARKVTKRSKMATTTPLTDVQTNTNVTLMHSNAREQQLRRSPSYSEAVEVKMATVSTATATATHLKSTDQENTKPSWRNTLPFN